MMIRACFSSSNTYQNLSAKLTTSLTSGESCLINGALAVFKLFVIALHQIRILVSLFSFSITRSCILPWPYWYAIIWATILSASMVIVQSLMSLLHLFILASSNSRSISVRSIAFSLLLFDQNWLPSHNLSVLSNRYHGKVVGRMIANKCKWQITTAIETQVLFFKLPNVWDELSWE